MFCVLIWMTLWTLSNIRKRISFGYGTKTPRRLLKTNVEVVKYLDGTCFPVFNSQTNQY